MTARSSTKAPELELAERLVRELLANGYQLARVLPDGSVAAVQKLITTHGLFLGMTPWGFDTRYCMPTFALALQRFNELQSEDDVPAGWVARRPERPEDIAAKSRPGYLGGDPALASSWEVPRDAETFHRAFEAMRQAPREGAA